ncbi:hypothetical protein M513_09118 [Trichuris suis]|uniref:Uncharacterized protein n=1 Tax=Trichuris suis TaxID=68888 RepID=A0A085LYH9_9BILA|nr:hypothetical protein M513_09118 [Trichuris suis]
MEESGIRSVERLARENCENANIQTIRVVPANQLDLHYFNCSQFERPLGKYSSDNDTLLQR